MSDHYNWQEYPDEYAVESVVGVWRAMDATRSGFVSPTPLTDQIANSIDNSVAANDDLKDAQEELDDLSQRLTKAAEVRETREYTDAFNVCQDDPVVKDWEERAQSTTVGPWYEEFRAAQMHALADPRVGRLKKDYDRCVRDAGLTPESTSPSVTIESIFEVEGQRFDRIDEAQVKMAVSVAECKEAVNGVRELLDIIAEYEAPVFLKYESELHAELVELEATRTKVQEFWSQR